MPGYLIMWIRMVVVSEEGHSVSAYLEEFPVFRTPQKSWNSSAKAQTLMGSPICNL